jgi:prepilin-type N-terminal cleavage/methylation domain-containing protein
LWHQQHIAVRPPAHGASEPAFTLLELLVVTAVVAVLAALLLPAMSSAQSKARQSKCTNNVRQLGTALQEFATEYRVFPPAFMLAEARANQGAAIGRKI